MELPIIPIGERQVLDRVRHIGHPDTVIACKLHRPKLMCQIVVPVLYDLYDATKLKLVT